jgi:hypothetical protein
MKIYELLEDLKTWLADQADKYETTNATRNDNPFRKTLDEITELEYTYE